jgi:hypothetical protein
VALQRVFYILSLDPDPDLQTDKASLSILENRDVCEAVDTRRHGIA